MNEQARHSLCVVLYAHASTLDDKAPSPTSGADWLRDLLPLLALLRSLEEDGLPGAVSLCLSPGLLQQLADPSRQARFERELARDLDEADDAVRLPGISPAARAIRVRTRDERRALRNLWHDTCDRHLIAEFRRLHRSGRIELLGSAASHAILPLAARNASECTAQIRVGLREFERFTGERARSFWLPHGGFEPGIDDSLAAGGIETFVGPADGPGAASQFPWPRLCPSGAIACAVDAVLTSRVLDPEDGYPASHPPETRRSELADDAALAHLRAQATHFTGTAADEFSRLAPDERLSAIRVLALPLSFLGRGWADGFRWLDAVVRQSAWEQDAFALRSLRDARSCLRIAPQGYPRSGTAYPDESFESWVCGENAWIRPHLETAGGRLRACARALENPRGLSLRTIDQGIREFLLAQNSDLALAMARADRHPERARCATEIFRDHMSALHRLLDGLENHPPDRRFLEQREGNNTVFPVLDYRDFAGP